MKVIPLPRVARVRSMATYVEVGRTGILIDRGTLAPSRFGLPPTEAEWEALGAPTIDLGVRGAVPVSSS